MAKKSDRQRVFVKARHAFSEAEWKVATRELTRAMEQVDEQEAQDKAESASRKAALKELKAKVNELRNKVASGGEERDTEATVEFLPKKTIKIFRHHCPGDPKHDTEIRREPMTQLDYEGQLPLEDEKREPKKGEQTGEAPPAQAPE